ncbi:MAG: hypothetical protein WHS86_11955 [Desulfosoma sp.]
MEKIEIEQSSKAIYIYSEQSSLALVGALVNKSTTPILHLDEVGGHSKISHKDVVKTSVGVLATGKRDLEAVRGLELLENVQVPVTELPTDHVALDVDVFGSDKSKTQKEGVSRTSQSYEG